MNLRSAYLLFGSIISTVAILFAIGTSYCAAIYPDWPKFPGQALSLAVVLLPPIFFWADWTFFFGQIPVEERDAAKHTHDLSRNIWLAVLVVLAYSYGIKIGP